MDGPKISVRVVVRETLELVDLNAMFKCLKMPATGMVKLVQQLGTGVAIVVKSTEAVDIKQAVITWPLAEVDKQAMLRAI